MSSAAPQMRGLLASATKKHTVIGIVFITSTTLAVKYFGRDKRIKQHEEYYKTYDAEKEFQRMRKSGIFQSAPPE